MLRDEVGCSTAQCVLSVLARARGLALASAALPALLGRGLALGRRAARRAPLDPLSSPTAPTACAISLPLDLEVRLRGLPDADYFMPNARGDGRVVGEAQRGLAGPQLARLGGQRARRATTSSPRASRWSIASGAGRRRQAEALAQRVEVLGARARPEVEVAAEHERVARRPTRPRARPRAPPPARRRVARRRWRAGWPRTARRPSGQLEAREQHAAPLGLERERQAPHRRDAPGRAHQQLVRAALVRGDQVGSHVGDRAPQRRAEVARGRAPTAPCARAAPRQRPQPARRRLLQQRHVPLERRRSSLRTRRRAAG